MKTWIKRTLIGVVSATLLVGGLAAYAKRSGHWHGPMTEERITEMRGKAVDRVSEKLSLDAGQKAKLNLLADEMVAQRKTWNSGGEDLRAEAASIVAGNNFDRSRAAQLFEQKSSWAQVAGPKVIGAMADFYDSLNPQQQQLVRDRMQQMQRHGDHHRDN